MFPISVVCQNGRLVYVYFTYLRSQFVLHQVEDMYNDSTTLSKQLVLIISIYLSFLGSLRAQICLDLAILKGETVSIGAASILDASEQQ